MRRPLAGLLVLGGFGGLSSTAHAQDADVGWTEDRGGFRVVVDPSGALSFEDDPPGPELYLLGMPVFAGAAGLTSGQLLVVSFGIGRVRHEVREHAGDPNYLEKRAIMNETFEARAAMRARWNARIMAEALAILPAYLEAIWNGPEPATMRRAILFALWDECAEEGNAPLRAGGSEARARIEGFIRRRLPPGSADAYSARELERLNLRRESRATFAPYETDQGVERYGRGPAPAMGEATAPLTLTPASFGAAPLQ